MAGDVLTPLDDELRSVARRLRRGATTATLASLEPSSGWPYASLVTVASALDGSPLLLLSGLSHHTRALTADPRCSLLFMQPGAGDPLAHPRLTVFGRARVVEAGGEEHARVRRRFLARHPAAARYADWLRPRSRAVAGIARGAGAVVRRGARMLAVYREHDDTLCVRSAVCPHLGCLVAWNAAEESWDCPCHGSRFDCHGRVVQGPANADLQAATLDADGADDERRSRAESRRLSAPAARR